jgi:hypothetical protein
MSFISVLDNIGKVFEDIVNFATDAEPYVNALDPGFAPIYDAAVEIATLVEAAFAGLGAKNAGKQKLAVAASLLHVKINAQQPTLKVAPPSVAQTTAYMQSVVDGLKAFGALQGKTQKM